MGLDEFKKAAIDLRTSLLNAREKGINLHMAAGRSKVYDFGKSKDDYYRKAVQVSFEQVVKHSSSLTELAIADEDNRVVVEKIKNLIADLDLPDKREEITSKIIQLASQIKVPETNRLPKPTFLPSEIKAEVFADIEELQKTVGAGCYRSAAILCGRILEVALHRKYFEATGVDLLEKSPGIGLGKIVAKLSEKNISFDPGLTQQIHLINNIRVSSVHAQEETFNPSKAQAEAMILYTMDILEKIFKNKNDQA